MIGDKTVLAIIPARGGSKGVPRKNIRLVAGKPLIAWTIEEAKKSNYIDRLIVSTDDPEIADISRRYGAEIPFTRPAELARDDTPGITPVLHALQSLPERYDLVVLLQATSPLRRVEDIEGCLEICVSKHFPACVSVVEPGMSPYWMYTLDERGRMRPLIGGRKTIVRRQELPEAYAINGAVYVAECQWLETNRMFVTSQTGAYLMPQERSVDIDTEFDLLVAGVLLSGQSSDTMRTSQ